MVCLRRFSPQREPEISLALEVSMAAAVVAAGLGEDGHDIVTKRDRDFLGLNDGAEPQQSE
jgi:hypothetical protein